MIHCEREVIENELVEAMLRSFDTVSLGLHNDVYPYVVPLSFGFHLTDEKLTVYVHCARRGYKLALLEKDPHVCCTFSSFNNFPKRIYKGHRHDYRSVMAFGVASRVDRQTDPEAYARALRCILNQYDRVPAPGERRGFSSFDPSGLDKMYVFKIECARKNVFAKSEFPVRRPEDVPYRDVYALEPDDEPFDIQDLVKRPKRHSDFELPE